MFHYRSVHQKPMGQKRKVAGIPQWSRIGIVFGSQNLFEGKTKRNSPNVFLQTTRCFPVKMLKPSLLNHQFYLLVTMSIGLASGKLPMCYGKPPSFTGQSSYSLPFTIAKAVRVYTSSVKISPGWLQVTVRKKTSWGLDIAAARRSAMVSWGYNCMGGVPYMGVPQVHPSSHPFLGFGFFP